MLNRMPSESLSASFLLRSLTINEHRPHLLLDCNSWEVECVLLGLQQWGARPITHCRLPGPLMLPRRGTLLIEKLHFMNLTQQFALYDWITSRSQSVQIISVASGTIDSLVATGDFLDGLFTTLSAVRLNARAQDRGSIDWRASC